MIPNPKRVSEIHKSMLDDWPGGDMPPCPYNKEDCKNCYKLDEPDESISNADADPCIRDVAHLAAKYEHIQNIAQGVADNRAKVAKRLKTSLLRLSKVDLKKALNLEKRPKLLRTYGKHRHETLRLNKLKHKFTDEKEKLGNRKLADFIFNIDRLIRGGIALQNRFIILAMDVLEPDREITEDAINKTRIRYRHLNKK